MDLAIAIRDLQQQANHFLFLFDSATKEHQELIDWLTGSQGLINSQELFDAFQTIGVRSEDVKLQIVIAAQRPIVQASEYHANFHFDRIEIKRLKKHLDPAKDPIQDMLRELANRADVPVSAEPCKKISDEVYYLTGGHPKCAKLLLSEIAKLRFSQTKWQKQRKSLFKRCVYGTIQSEIWRSIDDSDLIVILWALSVFRRFDQRMLGTFIKCGILPTALGVYSRDARQLRARLVSTYLVNTPTKETGRYNTMNYILRRVLSLSMQYNSPKQYKQANRIALEIFTERSQDSDQLSLRSVMSLIEIVYHSLKLLEMEPEIKMGDVCARIQKILEQHLLALLAKIDEDEHADFLSWFKDIWDKDEELQETINRITGNTGCDKTLSHWIEQLAYGG
jgi:hypothetical protein